MKLRPIALMLWLGFLVVWGASCSSLPKSKSPPVNVPPAAQEPGDLDAIGIRLKIVKRTLSNGLTVVLAVDPSVPMVSYQTWFKVGSVDELPGHTGMAHFFEHLMFKGTPKYGAKEFFQQLEAKGAEVNAFTMRDYTVYYESIGPELLGKVIEMESDRMANLIINEDVMKTELMVVLEERRLRTENSPAGQLQEALWELAYRRHPYHWPTIGYPQDLLSMSVGQLRSFFKTYYQPGNAVIVVTGNFDLETVYGQIRHAYEPLPGVPRIPRDIPADFPQNEERQLVLRGTGVASEQFAIAYHVTSADNDDSYALDVLANILFEGNDSRAYRLLVEQKDLMATVSGVAFTPTFPGLFMINGTMKGSLASSLAQEEIYRLIKQAQETLPTDAEIKKAVRQLTVQVVDSVRTPQGLGQLIGTVTTVFGDPERFSKDIAKYTRITAEDVRRVAEKYLAPNNRSVVLLKGESK